MLSSLQCWIFLHSIFLRPALFPIVNSANVEDAATRSTASLSTLSPTSIDDCDIDSQPSQHQVFVEITKALTNPPTPLRPCNQYHEYWCPYNIQLNESDNDFISLLANFFSPCSCISISSLIWAICAVLYRSTPHSCYRIVLLTTDSLEFSADAKSMAQQERTLSGVINRVSPQ